MARRATVVFLALTWAPVGIWSLSAASPQVRTTVERAAWAVRLQVPAGTDPQDAPAECQTYGARPFRTKLERFGPDTYVYRLQAPGKAIVYCPGFRLVLISPPGANQPEQVIALEALGSLPLSGRISGLDETQGVSIEIAYLAGWTGPFVGFIDGMTASFLVASVAPQPDGSFDTKVPDLLRDPVLALYPARPGYLDLRVRETRSGNIRAFVRPVDGAFAFMAASTIFPGTLQEKQVPWGLKLAGAYPPGLSFSAELLPRSAPEKSPAFQPDRTATIR